MNINRCKKTPPPKIRVISPSRASNRSKKNLEARTEKAKNKGQLNSQHHQLRTVAGQSNFRKDGDTSKILSSTKKQAVGGLKNGTKEGEVLRSPAAVGRCTKKTITERQPDWGGKRP